MYALFSKNAHLFLCPLKTPKTCQQPSGSDTLSAQAVLSKCHFTMKGPRTLDKHLTLGRGQDVCKTNPERFVISESEEVKISGSCQKD